MIREKIIFKDKKLEVPPFPIITYIEGDGVGFHMWKATKNVIDTAIEIAYGGERKIFWKQVYAGEKAFLKKGEWLPTKTLANIREHLVAFKGTLITPEDGGIRSLNVSLRQELDLFAWVRPVKYYEGVNPNSDYTLDAVAALVGAIRISPGANINYNTGVAIFEANHVTAPNYTGQDKVNPTSEILSGVMMLEYIGWFEAANLIQKGIEGALTEKTVIYGLERLMDGETQLKCLQFGKAIINNM